jgi:voltage-gated potassium channel
MMAIRHPLLRFRLPGILLCVAILYGTAGYVALEGWDVLDAFYMTLITISTVGYGEVHPLSQLGRLFTATLIMGGVGVVVYAFGIFTELLSEGHLAAYRRQRQMRRDVSSLRDHFIVCGYGRIGTRLVLEFEQERVPYVVVDNQPETVLRLQREGKLHIDGDAAEEDVLTLAGIARARGLISAVDSDERSVYITLTARALRRDLYILSRAGRPESIRRLELAGADRVVSPYQMAGHQMAELALRPALVKVMDTIHHGESDIGIDELLVGPESGALGKTLQAAELFAPTGARVLALRRRDGSLFVNPDRALLLEEGDLLVALGGSAQLAATAALVR